MVRRRDQAAAALAAMFFAALGVAAPAAGQTATDEGVWTAVSLRGKVSADAPWRWTADSFVQSREGVRTLDLAFEQVMVTFDVGRQVGVGFGYGVGAGFRNRGPLLEHRLTQLLTWGAGVHTRVSLRSLLEERFITGRDAMLLRARQQVRVVWPLAAQRRLRGVASAERTEPLPTSCVPRGPRQRSSRICWRCAAIVFRYRPVPPRSGSSAPSRGVPAARSCDASCSGGKCPGAKRRPDLHVDGRHGQLAHGRGAAIREGRCRGQWTNPSVATSCIIRPMLSIFTILPPPRP